MIEQIHYYLSYDFVRNALIAGSLAGILGAVVGYFVVIRKVSFAAHSLAHIGFTGATGAVLFALSPLEGMLIISVLAGVMMGAYWKPAATQRHGHWHDALALPGRGHVVSRALQRFRGPGHRHPLRKYFWRLASPNCPNAVLSAISLGTLLFVSRKLLFASVQPDLAEARGVSLSALSIVFMVILAVSVTLASQVVGILLVFTLIIGPAGIATRLCRNFWAGLTTSVVIGLSAVWSGILLACITSWPPTFWITTIIFGLYLITEAVAILILGYK